MFPSYKIEPPKGKIILYHNTSNENIQSILANGLKASAGKSQGRGKDGDFVWATSTPNLKGYGGNTIAFETDLEKANQYKVNNDQYTLPYDIPKEDILFVDKFFWDNYRLSDLPELIKKYGKDKVITIISKKPEKFHNNYNIDSLENLINQALALTEGFCFGVDMFNFIESNIESLTEANLYQLAVKTQNETPKLAARSDKVTPSYLGISKFGIYNFRVTSQTHTGNYWYQTIECPSLLNLDEILDEPNGHITARDIQIMLRQDNVKILCDCPAFLYWALKYMAWDDNYGIEPETRHPRVNNVHLQGALCKHLMAVVKLIQSGSILDNIAKDTEQYLRFQRGETSRLHNNPKAMSQANKKTDQIDYKTDSSYLNDYFRSLAGKNSFLDDQDIKGSLEAEIKKVAQTSPNMTLDDFISEEFGVDGVSGLAQELQISQDYINKYFKDLGF